MIRIHQLKIRPGHTEEQLRKKAAQFLHIRETDISSFQIVRRSIDARKKPDLFYSYVADAEIPGEDKVCRRFKSNEVSRITPVKYHFPQCVPGTDRERPVIVGMGPAGLFCGYYLALSGFRPILLERGEPVEKRMDDVETFWQTGVLNPESNVQFGEGGAGTFSDGKLNTLVKDKDGRNQAVLDLLASFGADSRIRYEAKPHIGTDVLCTVVKRMREEIIRLGGEVRFQSKVTEIVVKKGQVSACLINETELLPCSQLVLAVGHSARDTFQMLYEKEIPMEAKSFAVGLRVEHPQSMINMSQYGMEQPGELGAASYKVTAQTRSGRGVYSFCMCPGGFVVNASSEPGRLAVNGMSYSGRDGENANSAIIVSVTSGDYGSDHPLAGIEFQRGIEEKAYQLGNGKIPVQLYGEFKRRVQDSLKDLEEKSGGWEISRSDRVMPAAKGEYIFADVSKILPPRCNEAFVEGMESMGRQIPGFNREDAILSGVESRTSSPVRIVRGENMQSVVKGLYPCGEGAGYAGGITSAAMDGIRIAEAVACQKDSFEFLESKHS